MRHDMKWLLCERQRIGSSNKSIKTGKRLDPKLDYDSEDYDTGPLRMSSARRKQETCKIHHKTLNENLRPLFQFLDKSVGRVWNDVYSELRQNVDPRRAIDFHILQHLGWHVDLHVEMIDGVPYDTTASYGQQHEVRGLYVNPDSGILCNNVSVRPKRKPAPVTSLHWYDDVWFKLEVLKGPAKCGCVHFKPQVDPTRHYWEKREELCVHGNAAISRPLWYVIEYSYHKPDEVYKVVHHYDYGAAVKYGLKEGETHTIFYRDVPEKMKEPVVANKKVANKKELKLIREALETGESRS